MENDIIYFDVARINRGKKKVCRCKSPHYEIDTNNRIVMCIDCGAVVDPFEALISFVERYEDIEEQEEKMLEKAKCYQELADKELQRMIKNKTFKEMNENYKKGMFPICPECDSVFDPVKIKSWVNNANP